MSTNEVSLLLKRVDPTLSAHSFKVGATQVLERAVADNKLSLELKQRLLKHDPRDQSIETSLQYGRCVVSQARMLKTHEATRLL